MGHSRFQIKFKTRKIPQYSWKKHFQISEIMQEVAIPQFT